MFQANWDRGTAALAILLPLILCGGFAGAQQRDPQDVSTLRIEDLMQIRVPTVYGASKFEQKITEAPSFITIITSDEIGNRLPRIHRGAAKRPGIVRHRRSKLPLRRDPMVPGSYNDRTLIQIDGHWLNENVYDGAYVDTDFPVPRTRFSAVRNRRILRGHQRDLQAQCRRGSLGRCW
jgi:hypothetical protein